MNPNWKKAKWDVVPKEDLESWYEVEYSLNYQRTLATFRRFFPLTSTAEPNQENYESWDDPQMDEYLNSWEDKESVDARPQEMKDKEAANLVLFEEMAKENPELRRIADNLMNALGGLADIDDEEFSDFIEMDMMCDRIWESSMNQILDEDVDCSGKPNYNLNELMYGTRSLS